MKNKSVLILVVLAVCGLNCSAQTAEDIGITKRSTFDDAAVLRDPFLPIGWNKPLLVQAPVSNGSSAPAPIESYIRPEAFVVSSILFDRIPLAVINGKAYGEGDSIPFNAGGAMIKLQVCAIRDGAVTLSFNDFKVTCPIRAYQKPAPKK